MTQMSLHRIIAEIKHLEEKGVALPHVAFFSVDAKNLGSKTVETVLAEGQAAIDSELSKIDRLVKLKVARNKANSITTLKLGSKEVTIDEALAIKSQLSRYQHMVDALRSQTLQASMAENRHVQEMNSAIDRQIVSLSSGNNKPSEATIKAVTDQVKEMYPGKIFKAQNISKIEELETLISELTLELDYRLSEVNATTVVEIDL